MPLRPWVGPKGRQGGQPYGRPGRAESLFPYFKAVYSALPFYIKPTRRPGAAAERGKETLYIFVHSGGEGKIKTMGWIFGIAGAAAVIFSFAYTAYFIIRRGGCAGCGRADGCKKRSLCPPGREREKSGGQIN